LRWLDNVGKYLRALKVKIWRHKAKNTTEWASVGKEAKALRGISEKTYRKDTCRMT
jgi:hypothetical protein